MYPLIDHGDHNNLEANINDDAIKAMLAGNDDHHHYVHHHDDVEDLARAEEHRNLWANIPTTFGKRSIYKRRKSLDKKHELKQSRSGWSFTFLGSVKSEM